MTLLLSKKSDTKTQETDMNLCIAFCYASMKQMPHASERLQLILDNEGSNEEAMLILGWGLSSDLVSKHQPKLKLARVSIPV